MERTTAWWVDTGLAKLIGKPDRPARDAIVRVLDDVVRDVLGIGNDPLPVVYVDRHAPWARDLARGLHWVSLGQPPEPPTTDVLSILADRPLPDEQRNWFAQAIDMAYGLSYHRHIDTVAGPGASATVPIDRLRANLPWLDTMLLGWRLHLALEFLRLIRSDSLPD